MAAIWTELFSSFSQFLIYLKSVTGTGYVWIYALILLAVVIYTIVQLRRQVEKTEDQRKSQLLERYRRGDISKKEYEAEIKELEF